MGAGLMQLQFVGSQDIYLKSNPSLTFFKKVFKSHTSFAMEHITVSFNRTDTFINEKTTLKCKIPRHSDLISQCYLMLTLPEIVSDNILNFRWIENIACAIIDNYSITIGGSLIDKQYGEYMYLQNQLTYDQMKQTTFDHMTGNTIEMYAPDKAAAQGAKLTVIPVRYRISSSYPTAVRYDPSDPSTYRPSIKSRLIYIPLNFWFCKEIGNALPLVSLQYSEVEITIELRPWNELYQLFYKKNGKLGYWSPDPSIKAHHLSRFVSNVNQQFLISPTVLNCNCQMEINYITLDELERSYFAQKSLDYLIDQVTRIERPSVNTTTSIIDMVLQNPLKELIWVIKRNDQSNTNDWFTYQDKRDGISNIPILNSAKILFNGVDRISEKPAEYFNWIQPFQHHKGNKKPGLYVYSFAINPEEYQPSGSVNMSRINSVQMLMNLKAPDDDTYAYDVSIYAINHNFLRISCGLAGVVYSS